MRVLAAIIVLVALLGCNSAQDMRNFLESDSPLIQQHKINDRCVDGYTTDILYTLGTRRCIPL
jgi:hypothetical protein